MKYKLSYSTWGKEEVASIKKVLDTNMLTMGSKVLSFEKKFAHYLGRKYAVMTNSGSSANLLGVSALFFKKKNPLKKNDEVIVPALSWSTTYSPLQNNNLSLKIVDINLEDLNIDINLLKKSISKKTKMIAAVSILGAPANLDEIKKICKEKKIYLFEDNCESLGAKIGNKKTGTYGDFSTHSFFFSHHISTIEGGMVVTDDFELYCIMKSLRAHGWTRDLPKKNSIIKKNNDGFYEQYKFILPGYNLRPTEINAAIGIEQLKKLEEMIKIRNENLKFFEHLFKDDTRFIIQNSPYYNSSFCFPLVFKKKISKEYKNKFFQILKKNNIDFRLITGGCFTQHPYKKYFNYKIFKNLKNTLKVHRDGFFVGNTSKNLKKEILRFYNVIKNIK